MNLARQLPPSNHTEPTAHLSVDGRVVGVVGERAVSLLVDARGTDGVSHAVSVQVQAQQVADVDEQVPVERRTAVANPERNHVTSQMN